MQVRSALYFVRLIVAIGLIQLYMVSADENTSVPATKNIKHISKRGIMKFFEKTKQLFTSSSSSKQEPELITNFDVVRLKDQDVARTTFLCVVQQAPCDNTGIRMQGKRL